MYLSFSRCEFKLVAKISLLSAGKSTFTWKLFSAKIAMHLVILSTHSWKVEGKMFKRKEIFYKQIKFSLILHIGKTLWFETFKIVSSPKSGFSFARTLVRHWENGLKNFKI